MRVVVVHNYYDSRSPSGENAAVDDELEILAQAGIDVVPLLTSSDDLLVSRRARWKAAPAPVFAAAARRRLHEVLVRTKPDIVHLHNVYPRPGPSVIPVAQRHGVPVVQTVHNRRISCMAGTHFRDGRHCTDCVDRTSQWPGLVHACYRGSNAQSAVMAASALVHHRVMRRLEHYFAVSETIAEVLVAAGVTPRRITVKPNPVPDHGVTALPEFRRVLYAGRLEQSKGAALLLDAWRSLPPADRPWLRVCGTGPLEDRFAAAAATESGLEFVGRSSPAEVRRYMIDSTAVIMPSIAGEGMPRIVAEAFASARPVMATDQEPVASVIGPNRGWRFAPNAASLARTLSTLASCSSAELDASAAAARRYYERHFRPDAVLRQQRRVYDEVVTQGVH